MAAAGPRRKRIHVLGGGAWQVPTIRLAKELGYDVLVTDMYPDAPGYAWADEHEQVDIKDRERTLDAAVRHRVDGIICDTTDVGVPTAAYVAERLGLPGMGLETALRFTNKYLMRQAAVSAGVDNPLFMLVESEGQLAGAESMGYPLVVKPVDSQSSRGVRKVGDRAELHSAYHHAESNSSEGHVLVEQFVEGTEVTVEAMCDEGTVHVLGISDKEHYPEMPQVASRLTYPPDMSDELVSRITAANERVIGALGLRKGITHAEYMVTSEGRVFLVEIAARGGGSRIYTHIVPYLSGIPVPRLYLEYCLGDSSAWPRPNGGSRAAILDFFAFPPGTVRSIEGVDRARQVAGVADLAIELAVGQRFNGADNDRARPGYVVAFGSTREQVCEIARVAKDSVQVQMDR